MNINEWLPTQQDRSSARSMMKSFLKGFAALVGFLSIIVFLVSYPIVAGILFGSILIFILFAFLWTAFAPIQKENKDAE